MAVIAAAPVTSRTILVDVVVVSVLSAAIEFEFCERQKKNKTLLSIIALIAVVIKQMNFLY